MPLVAEESWVSSRLMTFSYFVFTADLWCGDHWGDTASGETSTPTFPVMIEGGKQEWEGRNWNQDLGPGTQNVLQEKETMPHGSLSTDH